MMSTKSIFPFRQQGLQLLAAAVCRWPWAFLLTGILLAVVAGIYAAKSLQFRTGRDDLTGRESEYKRLSNEYVREFKAEDDHVVVFESNQPKRNQAAVDAFVGLALSPENNPHPKDEPKAQQFVSDHLFYRVNPEALQPRFLFFLSVEELTKLRDSMKDFRRLIGVLKRRPDLYRFFHLMNLVVRRIDGASETQGGGGGAEEFLPVITAVVSQMGETGETESGGPGASPWASALVGEETSSKAQEEMKWQGYSTFSDGKMFIVLVHPQADEGETDGVSRDAATITKLRRIIGDVRQQFPDVHVSLTGEPVLAYDEMQTSQRDSKRATLLTLVLICVLFGFSFREVIRPLLAAACMALVLTMCMGYATLSVGHLNIITITFAVMILGLGIDLGIQFIARYEEELSNGETREKAIETTMVKAGTSILTAGVTNSAAFFAMGLSGFRGVIELGIIAGGGMLIATAATLTVLPALLLIVRRKSEPKPAPVRVFVTAPERLSLRRPYTTLIVCGAITAAALLIGWRVRFDYNVLNLQSHGLESVETELRLLRADAHSTIYAAVVADTLDETRRLHPRLEQLPTVHSVASAAPLIPEQQEEKARLIQDIQKELGKVRFATRKWKSGNFRLVLRELDALHVRADRLANGVAGHGDGSKNNKPRALADTIQRTRTTLLSMEDGKREQWLGDYQRRFYRDLETQLRMIETQVTDTPITAEDLPHELQRLFVGQTGKFLLRVFPRENIWDREPLVRFVKDVRSVAPKATGTPLGLYEFVDVLLRGYRNAALWALLVITIMIFADFRTVWGTILTVLPLLVGTAWMIGLMALTGIPFNPANIMVLPLLVGIGVAYGIYIVKRCRQDAEPTFYKKSTGRAVVLTALAAMAAFGSLLISAHLGIRSLGLLTVIGISACLVASMILLPALVQLVQRKRWKL